MIDLKMVKIYLLSLFNWSSKIKKISSFVANLFHSLSFVKDASNYYKKSEIKNRSRSLI